MRGESGDQGVGPTVMRTFWDRNFEDEDSVAWFRFQQVGLTGCSTLTALLVIPYS